MPYAYHIDEIKQNPRSTPMRLQGDFHNLHWYRAGPGERPRFCHPQSRRDCPYSSIGSAAKQRADRCDRPRMFSPRSLPCSLKKIPVAMKNSPCSFTRELPWQSIEIRRLFSLEIHDFQPISENFPAKSLLAGNFQTEHGSLWTASTTSLFQIDI